MEEEYAPFTIELSIPSKYNTAHVPTMEILFLNRKPVSTAHLYEKLDNTEIRANTEDQSQGKNVNIFLNVVIVLFLIDV